MYRRRDYGAFHTTGSFFEKFLIVTVFHIENVLDCFKPRIARSQQAEEMAGRHQSSQKRGKRIGQRSIRQGEYFSFSPIISFFAANDWGCCKLLMVRR